VGNLVYGSARREYVSERIEDLRQKIAENDMDNVCELLPDPIRDDLKSSILLYILGLCITLVLTKDQRKLVDTGSAAAEA
jgi:hypothetical protein